MGNSKIRAQLLITIDRSATVTETTVDFFDEEGSYFSGITFWADGKIAIHARDENKDIKFEDPRQLFQVLQAVSKSINNPTINKTENYTITNPAGEI